MMVLSKLSVAARDVYTSWFLHEQMTRPDVKNEHRQWFIEKELPRRARWPTTWYRCSLDPSLGPDFIVGGWKPWEEWGRPEGTYFRIAQRIVTADQIIPSQDAEAVRRIAIGSEKDPLWFNDDPLIVRCISLDGPFTVIEGHHRASAVALTLAERRCARPLAAFIGIGNI